MTIDDDLRSMVQTVLRDIGRIVAPRGVDTAGLREIGGTPQWVSLRGQDRRAPILLFLHGGPGSPVQEIAWTYQRPWEDFFVVGGWDQRGFGRSWGTSDLSGTLHQEQLVLDTIELIEQLCAELDQPKVVLVGQSWGTVLALEVAHRRPDLLHVVVTQGLAANWMASPERLWRDVLAAATARGDVEEASRLTALGPPPLAEGAAAVLAWAPAFGHAFPDHGTWHNIGGEGDGWQRRMEVLRLVSPDLSVEQHAEQESRDPGQLRARYAEMMSSVLPWDAARDVGTDFEVPLVVMMGTHDQQTATPLARAYFDRVTAPWKRWVEMPHAAHALNAEQPGLVLLSLVTDVLPAVRGEVPPGAVTGSS